MNIGIPQHLLYVCHIRYAAIQEVAQWVPTSPPSCHALPIFALAYNLVRLVMGQSASLQHLGVERISVVDALRGLGAPSTGGPLRALRTNPIRPQRVEPRAKKRRPKSFPFMLTPRPELRRQLVQHERSG